MSKSSKEQTIIPQSVNDRILYLRSEWRKTRKLRDSANKKFSELKRIVYLLSKVDDQPHIFIAELLDVSEQRISMIVKELEQTEKEVNNNGQTN